jgi:hypothetical protein
MVIRGQSYGTSAQREGKSAGQRQARNIRKHNRRLREQGKRDIVTSPKALRKHVEATSVGVNDLGVYGVYHEDDKWVLTALSVSVTKEATRYRNGWADGSTTDVLGRYVILPRNGSLPVEDGLELGRYETKQKALAAANASGSVGAGERRYVVRARQVTRSKHTTADIDALSKFKRRARKVWEH